MNVSFFFCYLCKGDRQILTNVEECILNASKDLLGVEIPNDKKICFSCCEKIRIFAAFKADVLVLRGNKSSSLQKIVTPPVSPTPTKTKRTKLREEETKKKNIKLKCKPPCLATFENDVAMVNHLRKDHLVKITDSNIIKNDQELFMCSQCSKTFLQQPSFVKHLIEEHSLYICNKCDYSTTNKEYLMRHMREIHEMKSSERMCPQCFIVFDMIPNYNAHNKEVHGIVIKRNRKSTSSSLNDEASSDSCESDAEYDQPPIKIEKISENIETNIKTEREEPSEVMNIDNDGVKMLLSKSKTMNSIITKHKADSTQSYSDHPRNEYKNKLPNFYQNYKPRYYR